MNTSNRIGQLAWYVQTVVWQGHYRYILHLEFGGFGRPVIALLLRFFVGFHRAMSMKRKHEDPNDDDSNELFEVIGKGITWSTIDEGEWKGMRSGEDNVLELLVALSSRNCMDTHRWITMPSLAPFENLKELDLHKSRYMRQLHTSICDLLNLETLILTRCERLTSLPEDLGRLYNLREVRSFVRSSLFLVIKI